MIRVAEPCRRLWGRARRHTHLALALTLAGAAACGAAASSPPEGSREQARGGAGDAAAPAPPEASAEVEAGSAACPVAGPQTSPGAVDDDRLEEISGIVQSARNAGVYWVHNDSGDSARAFALGPNGTVLAKLTFDDVEPTDIEDIAIEDVSPTQSYLYLGDIGDNDRVRDELVIHRVAEPMLDGRAEYDVTSDRLRVRYPDGAHDAETLLFDPASKELFILTKSALGTLEKAHLHRVGPFVPGGLVTTAEVGTADVLLANGGEVSRDGALIGIRNYGGGYVWRRRPGEALADALARPRCFVDVTDEKQGESFAFLATEPGYVTVSEGKHPALHLHRLER